MKKLLLLIAIMLGISGCTADEKVEPKPADSVQTEEKQVIDSVEDEAEDKEEVKNIEKIEKSSEELEKEELKEK